MDRINNLLKIKGYISLMPVQEQIIPLMLKRGNLVVESPTGSGKTLSYILPLLLKLRNDKVLKAIVLAPTKELGSQITYIVKDFTDKVLFLPDRIGLKRQIASIKKIRPQIIVGMPSRILELIDFGKLKLNWLEYIIIDEGDKVLKRDNLKTVERILKAAYKTTSLAVFSATYRPNDLELIKSYKENVYFITSMDIVGKTKHYYLMTSEMRKIDSLFKILRAFNSKKSITFINSTSGVEGLVKKINKQSREIFVLHKDMNMQKRKSVLEKFRKSALALLITIDIFSRGLDVPDVDCVVHYDLPRTGNLYIHRSGRTSRGFREGIVVSLVKEEEKGFFFDIRRMAGVHTKQISFNSQGDIETIKWLRK